jgi:hypothetical protein
MTPANLRRGSTVDAPTTGSQWQADSATARAAV